MKKVSIFALVATLALGISLSAQAEDNSADQSSGAATMQSDNMSAQQDQTSAATDTDVRMQNVQNDSGAN